MKSDGTDQMNTVAKTAEYPFERLAVRCDAASVRAGDILLFISTLVWICLKSSSLRFSQRIGHACRAQGAGPLRTADTTACPMLAPKLWDGTLHKFSRL